MGWGSLGLDKRSSFFVLGEKHFERMDGLIAMNSQSRYERLRTVDRCLDVGLILIDIHSSLDEGYDGGKI